MPFTTDVTAFAKQEKAYRIRLVGLMALVLALALTILPTFKSHIVSISSDSRLLKACDLCGLIEHDKCPNDPNKKEPGVCGCGKPDIDTDGDGALDCQDGCPNDANKKEPGVCGCGKPDTDKDRDGKLDCQEECPDDASKTSPGICGCGFPDTDKDRDGTPDCKDNCTDDKYKTSAGLCGCGVSDNDPSIVSICGKFHPYECEGCPKDYVRYWKDCDKQCFHDSDYCLEYRVDIMYEYDGKTGYYVTSKKVKVVQTGTASSNTIWEYTVYCDIYGCQESYTLNDVQCDIEKYGYRECLVCEDGNEYCYDKREDPPASNPCFWLGKKGQSLLSQCFGGKAPSPSDFEVTTPSNKLTQHTSAFLEPGT